MHMIPLMQEILCPARISRTSPRARETPFPHFPQNIAYRIRHNPDSLPFPTIHQNRPSAHNNISSYMEGISTYNIVVAVPTNKKLALFSSSLPSLFGWVFICLASGKQSGKVLDWGWSRVGGRAVEGLRVKCFMLPGCVRVIRTESTCG